MEGLIAAEQPGVLDNKKLIIKGTRIWMTERDLVEHFSKFGEVDSVCVKNKYFMDIPKLRSFAFLVYVNEESLDSVLQTRHIIKGRQVFPERIVHNVGNDLYVRGVTSDITTEDLKDYFGRFGTVLDIFIPYDHLNNQRGYYSFVTFDEDDVVQKLLNGNKVHYINGKKLRIWRSHRNSRVQGYCANSAQFGNVNSGQFALYNAYLQAPGPAIPYQPVWRSRNGQNTYWSM